MLFERIESPGLAHYSYIFGDGSRAAVVDPRRDCEIYREIACREGMRIRYIFETHRNEDYIIGSSELAGLTGAEIIHADGELDYQYGSPAEDGQKWRVGRLELEAISTPGHTPGSMSYLLREHGGRNWMVFTGDALFAGDVGRTDLPDADRAEEFAEMLYDSIFLKLLPLGNEVIVAPGHGAGSVCGADIADIPLTTIGFERLHNPKLKYESREEFAKNIGKVLERPPYFRKMERCNLEGAPLGHAPKPRALAPDEFEKMAAECQILDIRSEQAFGAAHVPGSLSIWENILAGFAGWYLEYDTPILLVTDGECPVEASATLARMGYDEVAGYLYKGMLSWHMSGKDSGSIRTLTVRELCSALDAGDEPFILDVRGEDEIASGGEIPGAREIHVTRIPDEYENLPKEREIFIFCGSGMRSMLAASYLANNEFTKLAVVLGGLSGWSSGTCEIQL